MFRATASLATTVVIAEIPTARFASGQQLTTTVVVLDPVATGVCLAAGATSIRTTVNHRIFRIHL